jgi:hypothetical protein
MAIKKTVKKVKQKKTVTKNPVSKRVTKKSAKATVKPAPKKQTVKKVVAKKLKKKKGFVVLPETVSQEMEDKSKSLRSELESLIHKSFYSVAYASAFCFMLVGGTLAVASAFGGFSFNVDNVASIASSTEDCGSLSTCAITEGVSINEPVPETLFDLISEVPRNPNGLTKVVFVATFTSDIKAELKSIGNSSVFPLPVANILGDKHKMVIDTTQYVKGYYQITLRITPQNGDKEIVYFGRDFFMGSESEEYEHNHPEETIYVEETETIEQEEVASSTPVSLPEEVVEITGEVEAVIETVEEVETTDLIQEEETLLVEDGEEMVSEEEDSTIEPKLVFTLEHSGSDLSRTAVVKVRTKENLPFIELYARPLNSLEFKFHSLAIKTKDDWRFIFDSRKMPNGKYEFIAKSTQKEKLFKSEPIVLSVKNEVEDMNKVATTEFETEEEGEEERKFMKLPEVYPESTETTAQEEVRLILSNTEAPLNDLLKKYAVAVQSGDEALIKAVEGQLYNEKDQVVLEALGNKEINYISDDIDEELTERIVVLQKRVKTFEELRKTRSSGDTAKDTDGDGVSDVDELTVFKTNPNSPDSDNDGINDGVEIIRGFNPISAESEAVITYESPKDFKSLERNDVLKVEKVTPVIPMEESNAYTNVKTEITGKGLPNSFVTLYIFSSPTIATVKTDADGSFVYTFDKELEDGEHEVYIAVTDNTGSIIAQSSPFSFIKEAQAFSPVGSDEEESVVISSVAAPDSGNSYGIVIGIGVLTLGVILLMLGIGLRTREEIAVEANFRNKDNDPLSGRGEMQQPT